MVIFTDAVGRNFNTALTPRSRSEWYIRTQNPTLKMTSTRIELSFNKIKRLDDLSDLAEMLFPGNKNQQHAFLVIWISLKWADHRIVPNFSKAVDEQDITKRTLERVRAKMRRMGLIDHVSRFNAKHGYKEGWVLSTRFEKSLKQLTAKVTELKETTIGSKDKDLLSIQLAEARKEAARNHDQTDEVKHNKYVLRTSILVILMLAVIVAGRAETTTFGDYPLPPPLPGSYADKQRSTWAYQAGVLPGGMHFGTPVGFWHIFSGPSLDLYYPVRFPRHPGFYDPRAVIYQSQPYGSYLPEIPASPAGANKYWAVR